MYGPTESLLSSTVTVPSTTFQHMVGLEKRVTTRGQTQRKEIRFREWKKGVRKKGDRTEVNENRKLELNK